MTCFSSAGISGSGTRDTCIDPSAGASAGDVERRELVALVREVLAEVAAAALLALDRRARDRLRDVEQVAQIEAGVPAGVVFAMAVDADLRRALAAAPRASPAPPASRFRCGRCRPGPAWCPADRPAPCTGSRRARRARTARATPSSPARPRHRRPWPRPPCAGEAARRIRRRACRRRSGPTASCRRGDWRR